MTILATGAFIQRFSRIARKQPTQAKALSSATELLSSREREKRLGAQLLSEKLKKEPDLLKTPEELFSELVEKFEAGIASVLRDLRVQVPKSLNEEVGKGLRVFQGLILDGSLDINDLRKRFAAHLGLSLGQGDLLLKVAEGEAFKEYFSSFVSYCKLVDPINVSNFVNS